jgi:hypothetical protein
MIGKVMANMNHAREELIKASKSFARRRARFNQPSVRSTSQRFGRMMNPLIALSERLTTFSRIWLVRVPFDPDHAFRLIVIIDSGDPDHAGDDGAVRLPLTVFNRG